MFSYEVKGHFCAYSASDCGQAIQYGDGEVGILLKLVISVSLAHTHMNSEKADLRNKAALVCLRDMEQRFSPRPDEL